MAVVLMFVILVLIVLLDRMEIARKNKRIERLERKISVRLYGGKPMISVAPPSKNKSHNSGLVIEGIKFTSEEANKLSQMDLKEQKYFISEKKMAERRNKAKPYKTKKKKYNSKPAERSFKDRVGGVRRAS
jgi:Tfp pilus assembly protein PilN